MRKTATFIKMVYHSSEAAQSLYKLSEPLEHYESEVGPAEYVIVSALPMAPDGSGSETFIFKANEEGEITDGLEMKGSVKNTLSHKVALKKAGYDLIYPPEASKKFQARTRVKITCLECGYSTENLLSWRQDYKGGVSCPLCWSKELEGKKAEAKGNSNLP